MADVPNYPEAPPRRDRQPEVPTPDAHVEQVDLGKESAPDTHVEESAPVVESVSEPTAPLSTPVAVPTAVPSYKDPELQKIEEILSEDLTEMYLALSPEKQVAFKEKGEETATAIQKLMAHAHANAKKIFSLIRAWLKMLPGVNRFFLEQEAKIKTDKIIHLP